MGARLLKPSSSAALFMIIQCWENFIYGSGVSVGMPPNGVGVSVTPKLDSNQ